MDKLLATKHLRKGYLAVRLSPPCKQGPSVEILYGPHVASPDEAGRMAPPGAVACLQRWPPNLLVGAGRRPEQGPGRVEKGLQRL
jgi:hypothetical protein